MVREGSTETLRIGRRDVRITHPDKLLFPRARITKLDLARHYERVAPVMLPYVSGRPLALQVFPDGVDERRVLHEGGAQVLPGLGAPGDGGEARGRTVTHALADDAATLAYLAGQNVVTPHIWLSRADEPRSPTA